MSFLTGFLWGLGIGVVGVPLVIWIRHIIIKTLERRNIKRMIHNKQFLVPIDKKDYDVKAWENDINITDNQQQLQRLNDIFIKKEDVGNGEIK